MKMVGIGCLSSNSVFRSRFFSIQKCGRISVLVKALSEVVWIVALYVQAMSRSEIKK